MKNIGVYFSTAAGRCTLALDSRAPPVSRRERPNNGAQSPKGDGFRRCVDGLNLEFSGATPSTELRFKNASDP